MRIEFYFLFQLTNINLEPSPFWSINHAGLTAVPAFHFFTTTVVKIFIPISTFFCYLGSRKHLRQSRRFTFGHLCDSRKTSPKLNNLLFFTTVIEKVITILISQFVYYNSRKKKYLQYTLLISFSLLR